MVGGNPYHYPHKKKKGNDNMKITLYIDWRGEKILTEKVYKTELERAKNDESSFEDYKIDSLEDYIEEYLDEKKCSHTFETVFNLSDNERKEILDNVRKGYLAQVEQDLTEEYEKITIDI